MSSLGGYTMEMAALPSDSNDNPVMGAPVECACNTKANVPTPEQSTALQKRCNAETLSALVETSKKDLKSASKFSLAVASFLDSAVIKGKEMDQLLSSTDASLLHEYPGMLTQDGTHSADLQQGSNNPAMQQDEYSNTHDEYSTTQQGSNNPTTQHDEYSTQLGSNNPAMQQDEYSTQHDEYSTTQQGSNNPAMQHEEYSTTQQGSNNPAMQHDEYSTTHDEYSTTHGEYSTTHDLTLTLTLEDQALQSLRQDILFAKQMADKTLLVAKAFADSTQKFLSHDKEREENMDDHDFSAAAVSDTPVDSSSMQDIGSLDASAARLNSDLSNLNEVTKTIARKIANKEKGTKLSCRCEETCSCVLPDKLVKKVAADKILLKDMRAKLNSLSKHRLIAGAEMDAIVKQLNTKNFMATNSPDTMDSTMMLPPLVKRDKDGYDEWGYDKNGQHNGETDEDREFKKYSLSDPISSSGSGDEFYATLLTKNKQQRRLVVAKVDKYLRETLESPARKYVEKVVSLSASRFDQMTHYETAEDFKYLGLLNGTGSYDTNALMEELGMSTDMTFDMEDSFPTGSTGPTMNGPSTPSSLGFAFNAKIAKKITAEFVNLEKTLAAADQKKCLFAGYTPEWGEYSADWQWYTQHGEKMPDSPYLEPGSVTFATAQVTSDTNDPFSSFRHRGLVWAHESAPPSRSGFSLTTEAARWVAVGAGNCPVHMAAGSECKPTCKKGTTPSGVRLCSENGKLLDTFVCTPNNCERPIQTPTNGVDKGGNCAGAGLLAHGSFCKPTCRSKDGVGYHGEGARYCFLGRILNRFKCVENGCDMTQQLPSNVLGAGSCLRDHLHGEVCQLVCESGYYINGERVCESGAVKDTSKCKEKPCDASAADLPFLVGLGSCTPTLASGAMCQPICDNGNGEEGSKSYHAEGTRSCKLGKLTDTFQCVGNACLLCWGTENKEVGENIPATCINEPHTKWNIDDDKQCSALQLTDSSCKMACKVGYRAEGKYVCDASVLADTFHCIEQTCNVPVTFGIGMKGFFSMGACVAGGIMPHDSKCDPKCMQGYSRTGNIECFAGKMKSNMKCNPLPCQNNTAASPTFGEQGDCTSIMKSGASCTPTCNDGYHLEPSKKVCHLGSIEKEPVCVENTCDATKLPKNAQDVGTCAGQLDSGAMCQPTCKDGYHQVGARTCGKGVLTDTFKCVGDSCTAEDSTALLENGVEGGCEKLRHGESCTPSCKYVHMIRNNVECLHDGTTPVKEEMLGMYDTLEDCADACRDTEGCKYFQYGIGSGKKVNFCIWKKAPNEACKDFDSEGRWMLSYKRWMWSEFTASVDFDFYSILTNDPKYSGRYDKVGWELKGARKCLLGKIVDTSQCVPRTCTMETSQRLLSDIENNHYGTPYDEAKNPIVGATEKLKRDNGVSGMNVPSRLYGHVKTWNVDWKRFIGASIWQGKQNSCLRYEKDLAKMCDEDLKAAREVAKTRSHAICAQTEKHIHDWGMPDYSNKKFESGSKFYDASYAGKGLSRCDPRDTTFFGGTRFYRIEREMWHTKLRYGGTEKNSYGYVDDEKGPYGRNYCHNPNAHKDLIADCLDFRRKTCMAQAGEKVDGQKHNIYQRLFDYGNNMLDYMKSSKQRTCDKRRNPNCFYAKASQCREDLNGDGVAFVSPMMMKLFFKEYNAWYNEREKKWITKSTQSQFSAGMVKPPMTCNGQYSTRIHRIYNHTGWAKEKCFYEQKGQRLSFNEIDEVMAIVNSTSVDSLNEFVKKKLFEVNMKREYFGRGSPSLKFDTFLSDSIRGNAIGHIKLFAPNVTLVSLLSTTKSSGLKDGGFGCASNYPSSDAGCPQSHPHCKGYVHNKQWGRCWKFQSSRVLLNNIGCNILKDGEACQPHCDAYSDWYINDLEFTDKENNGRKHEPKGSVSCNKGRYEWKDFSCARVLEPCNAASVPVPNGHAGNCKNEMNGEHMARWDPVHKSVLGRGGGLRKNKGVSKDNFCTPQCNAGYEVQWTSMPRETFVEQNAKDKPPFAIREFPGFEDLRFANSEVETHYENHHVQDGDWPLDYGESNPIYDDWGLRKVPQWYWSFLKVTSEQGAELTKKVQDDGTDTTQKCAYHFDQIVPCCGQTISPPQNAKACDKKFPVCRGYTGGNSYGTCHKPFTVHNKKITNNAKAFRYCYGGVVHDAFKCVAKNCKLDWTNEIDQNVDLTPFQKNGKYTVASASYHGPKDEDVRGAVGKLSNMDVNEAKKMTDTRRPWKFLSQAYSGTCPEGLLRSGDSCVPTCKEGYLSNGGSLECTGGNTLVNTFRCVPICHLNLNDLVKNGLNEHVGQTKDESATPKLVKYNDIVEGNTKAVVGLINIPTIGDAHGAPAQVAMPVYSGTCPSAYQHYMLPINTAKIYQKKLWEGSGCKRDYKSKADKDGAMHCPANFPECIGFVAGRCDATPRDLAPGGKCTKRKQQGQSNVKYFGQCFSTGTRFAKSHKRGLLEGGSSCQPVCMGDEREYDSSLQEAGWLSKFIPSEVEYSSNHGSITCDANGKLINNFKCVKRYIYDTKRPDRGCPFPFYQIKLEDEQSTCLAMDIQTKNKVSIKPCNRTHVEQQFDYSAFDHLIRVHGDSNLCLEADASDSGVLMSTCDAKSPRQLFVIVVTKGRIRQVAGHQRCLEIVSGKPVLRKCRANRLPSDPVSEWGIGLKVCNKDEENNQNGGCQKGQVCVSTNHNTYLKTNNIWLPFPRCASSYPETSDGCPQRFPQCRGYLAGHYWGKCVTTKHCRTVNNQMFVVTNGGASSTTTGAMDADIKKKEAMRKARLAARKNAERGLQVILESDPVMVEIGSTSGLDLVMGPVVSFVEILKGGMQKRVRSFFDPDSPLSESVTDYFAQPVLPCGGGGASTRKMFDDTFQLAEWPKKNTDGIGGIPGCRNVNQLVINVAGPDGILDKAKKAIDLINAPLDKIKWVLTTLQDVDGKAKTGKILFKGLHDVVKLISAVIPFKYISKIINMIVKAVLKPLDDVATKAYDSIHKFVTRFKIDDIDEKLSKWQEWLTKAQTVNVNAQSFIQRVYWRGVAKLSERDPAGVKQALKDGKLAFMCNNEGDMKVLKTMQTVGSNIGKVGDAFVKAFKPIQSFIDKLKKASDVFGTLDLAPMEAVMKPLNAIMIPLKLPFWCPTKLFGGRRRRRRRRRLLDVSRDFHQSSDGSYDFHGAISHLNEVEAEHAAYSAHMKSIPHNANDATLSFQDAEDWFPRGDEHVLAKTTALIESHRKSVLVVEQLKVEHPEEYQQALLEIKSQEEAEARAKTEEASHAQAMSALTAGKQGARLLLTTRRNGLRKKGKWGVIGKGLKNAFVEPIKLVSEHVKRMCKANTIRRFDNRANYGGVVSELYANTYRTTLERQLDELGTKSSGLADGGFGCASHYPSSDAGCPQTHPRCTGYVHNKQWGTCWKIRHSDIEMKMGSAVIKKSSVRGQLASFVDLENYVYRSDLDRGAAIHRITSRIFWELEAGSRGWANPRDCGDEGETCECVGFVDFGTDFRRWGLTEVNGKISCQANNFVSLAAKLGNEAAINDDLFQDEVCLKEPRTCQCIAVKTIEEEGWKVRDTETTEWKDNADVKFIHTRYDENLKCYGYAQLGSEKHNIWWGTRMHFSFKYLHHETNPDFPHNQVSTCNEKNFGNAPDSIPKGTPLTCRCMVLNEHAGTDQTKLESLKTTSLSDCRSVYADTRQLDQGSVQKMCAHYAEYVASYANFVAMADEQAERQQDKFCHLNEWASLILKALKSLANMLGETMPLGDCITFIIDKLMSIIDKIINPILKALQFDKLFDPIKQKIYDLMQPLISKFKFGLPDLKQLIPSISGMDLTLDFDVPKLFAMDFGKELFDPFTKGFARLRDDPYFLKAMEIANEVKAAASEGALQKCMKEGVKKVAATGLDLGQRYALCQKIKRKKKTKSCSSEEDQKKMAESTDVDHLFDEIMKE